MEPDLEANSWELQDLGEALTPTLLLFFLVSASGTSRIATCFYIGSRLGAALENSFGLVDQECATG